MSDYREPYRRAAADRDSLIVALHGIRDHADLHSPGDPVMGWVVRLVDDALEALPARSALEASAVPTDRDDATEYRAAMQRGRPIHPLARASAVPEPTDLGLDAHERADELLFQRAIEAEERERAALARIARLSTVINDIVGRMANFDYDGTEPPHPGVIAAWRSTLLAAIRGADREDADEQLAAAINRHEARLRADREETK